MSFMKSTTLAAAFTMSVLLQPVVAADSGSATSEEVVRKVQEAANYLQQKGKSAYPEFNAPSGRWVWKDSYVFLYNCQKDEMVAHPFRPDLVGKPLLQITDASDKPIFKELCNAGRKPGGGWVEYVWSKPGEGGLSRKISYAQGADVSFEFGVQAAAGIYDNEASVEELTVQLEKTLDPTKYPALD